jgi:hypothetical protein
MDALQMNNNFTDQFVNDNFDKYFDLQSNDDEHGFVHVNDTVQEKCDIESNDDCTFTYNGDVYDSILDIVDNNQEVKNVFFEEMYDNNWMYN